MINSSSLKRFLCAILSCGIIFSNVSFASDVVISSTYKLADGVTFTKEDIVDSDLDKHKSFVIEYTPDSPESAIAFLYGSNLNTRTTVTELVNNSPSEYGHPVAAMNADFFNMSTGLAESAIIKNGKLLTSDRDNYAFAFDKKGTPFIDKPAVSMILNTPYDEYTVLHFNKEFTEYGLYLYSPDYGTKTRINEPSVELILLPYSHALDYEGLSALMYGEAGVPFDLYLKVKKEADEERNNENAANEDGEADAEIEKGDTADAENGESDVLEKSVDEEAEVAGEYEIIVNKRYKNELEEYAKENGFVQDGMMFYKFIAPEVVLGSSVGAVVKEVRNNTKGESLNIPEDCFVLAANAATQLFKIEDVVEGDRIEITFNCNERFVGVSEAIGCGALIVEDGTIKENTNLSHYFSPNPRTAIGIKKDGKIVMFAVDGRQKGYSNGLTLNQLSEEMIRLGCVTAANFDGGGSTVVKAYIPGFSKISTVNSPSDGSERKVSNAVAFYNAKEPDGSKAYSYLDSEHRLVLSNSELRLGRAFFVDKAYYPSGVSPENINKREENKKKKESNVTDDKVLQELFDNYMADSGEQTPEEEKIINYDYFGFTYTVSDKQGVIQDGFYRPMGYVGDVTVISTSPEGLKNEAVHYTSLGEVDNITIQDGRSNMYVGDTLDLSAKSFYKGFEVVGGDNCYIWKSNNSSALSIDDDGVVTAKKAKDDVKITASFGENAGVFYVNVLDLPFNDISTNWAKESIILLYDNGISNGELTDEGRFYYPSRTFTRTEFCVMLARLLGLTKAVDAKPDEVQDVQEESDGVGEENNPVSDEIDEPTAATEFLDFESIPEWAKDSVSALCDNGSLAGFEHITQEGKIFDGSAFVTRREVIRLIGGLVEDAPADYSVKYSDIKPDDPDLNCIKNVLHSGIFNGYLDGTMRADNHLTRAEVSAVFIRLIEKM